MAGFKYANIKITNSSVPVAPSVTTPVDWVNIIGEEPTTIASVSMVKLDDIYSMLSITYKV